MSFVYNKIASLSGVPALLEIKWSWSGANQTETTKVDFPCGFAIEFVTVPASSPTANYDLVVTDAAGTDILRGAGADRSQTTAERAVIRDNGVGYPAPFAGVLTFTISNQANGSATGDVYLYVRFPDAR